MPIPLLLIGAGIMAAAGAAKSIHGASQAAKGRRLAAGNARPDYNVQQEYFDNQGLAENMAQSGLSEEALNYYTTNAQRGLSVSIDGLLQSGGGANSIAGAIDNYNRSLSQVAAADAEMKNNNLRYLVEQNKALAGQKTMKWSLNEYEPYKDKAAAATAMQKTGTENIFNGVSQIGAAGVAASSAFNYSGSGGSGGGGGDEGIAGTWIGGGGTPAQRKAISSVLPSATVEPAGTAFNSSANLESVYASSASNPTGGYGSIDQIMGDYANSPYKDLIRRRLMSSYGG
jgi:hypothetical protein